MQSRKVRGGLYGEGDVDRQSLLIPYLSTLRYTGISMISQGKPLTLPARHETPGPEQDSIGIMGYILGFIIGIMEKKMETTIRGYAGEAACIDLAEDQARSYMRGGGGVFILRKHEILWWKW